ncbi:MAG: hypothetical protein JWP06_192 [Candidatus Saccharibacteria bacterium]|nr:hypothetical protein [Candidatus Saccharibacteria bacterium]
MFKSTTNSANMDNKSVYTTFMVRHAQAQKHLQQKARRDPLDWVLYTFMVATPLFEIPQVVEIYRTKSAQNVSLITWSFFALSNLAWIAYAIRHKLWPLVLIYSIYFVLETCIVAGILLYR